MTRVIRVLLPIVAMLTVASCANFVLVKPDKKVAVNGSLTVDPQIDWNRLSVGKTEIWTVDGITLQELRFFVGLKDGDILFPSYGPAADSEQDKKKPKFSGKMSPIEVVEFFDASLSQRGLASFKAINLRPDALGGLPGFRFDFSFVTESGLEHEGFAVGVVNDEQLFLIAYAGTRLHFYPKHRDDVERLIGSVCFGDRLDGKPAGTACTSPDLPASRVVSKDL